MIVSRFLIVTGGYLLILDGWWARHHSADTPRYSAGIGSGFTPATRRFWGTVVIFIGLVIVLSGIAGVPAEIMRGR